MFDGDVGDLDPDTALAVAADLRATSHLAEIRLLQVAAHWGDLHGPDPDEKESGFIVLPGMQRSIVYGGDGCPEVAEFACAELGAALAVSSQAAASLIGDALALRHRFPRTWARVLAGEVPPWRARKIASACLRLSREAAAVVDSQVARIADRLTDWRLKKIIAAAILAVDPEQAKADADAAARERGVWAGRSDEHGTRNLVAKAAAGDIARFDARIDQVADILADLGHPGTKDQRRADAIGWLADPHAALELITYASTATADPGQPDAEAVSEPTPEPTSEPATGNTSASAPEKEPAPEPEPMPEPPFEPPLDSEATPEDKATPEAETVAGAGSERESGAARAAVLARLRASRSGSGPGAGIKYVVYVHLTDLTLATGGGVLRTETRGGGSLRGEDLGPLLASQLGELLGPNPGTIVVKPVIDLADRVSVDAYEIPDRIRERVRLQQLICNFPWCNRPAIQCDLDHITPHTADANGPPGQTGTDTLAPGCRFHHRIKTHGGWTVQRLSDGAFLWTDQHGNRYLVDHTGTRVVEPDLGDTAA